MSHWSERLGSMLVVAGLSIIIACVYVMGEQVRKDSVSIGGNGTAAVSYYLHDNDVEFVIEIIPSGPKANILLVNSDQLESIVEGTESKPLVEFKSVDGADFRPQQMRGLHVLFIRNISDHGVSAFITCISSGIQRDIVYVGAGTTALGFIILVGPRIGRKKGTIF